MQQHDPDQVIADLHKRLKSTLLVLSSYVEKHGMMTGREDETLGIGSVVLQRAYDAGVIDQETGKVPRNRSLLPVDTDDVNIMSTILPEAMVYAGDAALEAANDDMANYVSGVTTDWDGGMIAVAIYRAMTRQARLKVFECSEEGDDEASVVEEIDAEHAARAYALLRFDERMDASEPVSVVVTAGRSDRILRDAFGMVFDVTLKEIDGKDRVTAMRRTMER